MTNKQNLHQATVLAAWTEKLGCGESLPWPTPVDGVKKWVCRGSSGCMGGAEVVTCTFKGGHNFPFHKDRSSNIGLEEKEEKNYVKPKG